MGDCVEKIYYCDRDNNDNTLVAAILANGNNRRDDWGPMAAMMGGGMNNWMNNPFAYLMFLALLCNEGFGFGGDGAGTATQVSLKSGLTSEVEAQKANAEQVLASASKAQNIIDKAPSLLAELNPMYKEKQETEQRFGKIEGSIGEMKELMKKQQEMMENFIKKFES